VISIQDEGGQGKNSWQIYERSQWVEFLEIFVKKIENLKMLENLFLS
jgi:hypothetical protein